MSLECIALFKEVTRIESSEVVFFYLVFYVLGEQLRSCDSEMFRCSLISAGMPRKQCGSHGYLKVRVFK